MRTAQSPGAVVQDTALQGGAVQEPCAHQPQPQALLLPRHAEPSQGPPRFRHGISVTVSTMEEIHLPWVIRGTGGISSGKLPQEPADPLVKSPPLKTQLGSQSILKYPHLHSPNQLMGAPSQPRKYPKQKLNSTASPCLTVCL